MLLSAFTLRLLYELVRRKLHPCPSLAELREHRQRIDQSQTFGTLLAARLAIAPSLGLRDVWDIFGDYGRVWKQKKAKRDAAKKNGPDAAEEPVSGDDASSVHSASYSTSELLQDRSAQEAEEDADLKRIGLFLMNEVADLLERVKKCVCHRSLDDVRLTIVQHLPLA